MKLSDSINYALTKAKRNKRNIYFIVILAICTATILGAFYYRNTFLKGIEYTMNNDINFRTYGVFASDKELSKYFEDKNYDLGYSKILDIEHVEDIYYSKYNQGVGHTDTYKNEKYAGSIWLKYGSDATLPEEIEGRRFKDTERGVAICSKYFYPFNKENIDYFDNNMFLTTDDILNTTLNINKEIIKPIDGQLVTVGTYNKNFKIVGTFDPLATVNLTDTCFISPADMIEFYETVNTSQDEYSISAMNVVVDSIDNMEYVANELSKMKFSFSPNAYIDAKDVTSIKYVSNIIIMITISAIIIVTILYVDKKNINEQHELGLLKSLGFKNKDIKLIKLIDTLLATIFSYVMGLLLIETVLLIINIIFKNYLIYNGITIYHSFISYIIVYAVIVLLPIVTSFWYTNKSSKKKVINMIKE